LEKCLPYFSNPDIEENRYFFLAPKEKYFLGSEITLPETYFKSRTDITVRKISYVER
jgi:hypothetical protein